MLQKLRGHRVAILATDGFEESELLEPLEALRDAGADVHVVSPKRDSIKGWKHKDWGKSVDVNAVLGEAQTADYDALMLPGGVMNPDSLRTDRLAIEFIREMADAGKPIAAICHGPQLLIDAGLVAGHTLTSWPSIKLDLINAGAHWVNETVVSDHGLVTSRMPEDLPAFNKKMIEEFAEGKNEPTRRRHVEGRSNPRSLQ